MYLHAIGDTPAEDVAARDPEGWIARLDTFSDEDQMILMELHGKEVTERIKKAVEEHEKAGGDWKTQGPIYSKVRVQLLEKYREEIEQEKMKTEPVVKARKEYEREI